MGLLPVLLCSPSFWPVHCADLFIPSYAYARLLVLEPTPSFALGLAGFFSFFAPVSPFFGLPLPFFSPLAAVPLVCFSDFSVFCFFPLARTSFPSSFLVKSSSPSALSSLLRFWPPLAFFSTFSSDAFLTTLLPPLSIAMPGLSGSAFFLMVLPFFDLTATSPSFFFSATVPPGAPAPQFQETMREECQSEGRDSWKSEAPRNTSSGSICASRLKRAYYARDTCMPS